MKWLLDVYTSGKGIPKDSEAGLRQFGSLMERRRAEESVAGYEQIRRDWVLGSEASLPSPASRLRSFHPHRPPEPPPPAHALGDGAKPPETRQ